MANSTHDEHGVKQTPCNLVIPYDLATKQFQMQGNPPDQITALGMLSLAEHMIRSGGFQPQRRSAIVKAPTGLTVPRSAQ